jgi:hypothetical protein
MGFGACTIVFAALIPGPTIRSLPLSADATKSSQLPRFGVCHREGLKVVGTKPILPGKNIVAPKKIRNVKPRYPDLPEGTSVSGIWIGEVLVDAKGKIAEVWQIREVRLTPPFPAFNESIVAAIRQWEYEPLLVDSQTVPWCMTVTVNIDLR